MQLSLTANFWYLNANYFFFQNISITSHNSQQTFPNYFQSFSNTENDKNNNKMSPVPLAVLYDNLTRQ